MASLAPYKNNAMLNRPTEIRNCNRPNLPSVETACEAVHCNLPSKACSDLLSHLATFLIAVALRQLYLSYL